MNFEMYQVSIILKCYLIEIVYVLSFKHILHK